MPVPPRWRRRLRARLRRSRASWWSATALLALLTFAVVRAAVPAPAAARWHEVVSVPVVVAPVPAGAVVAADDVALEERPAATVPDGAFTGAGWAGRTALAPLVPGEVLATARLAPDGVHGVVALLPEGTRAIAVPGGPGGRPPLAVGDRVDVLVTLPPGPDGAAPATFTVADAALVVALDREADAVTVAVTPDEAADVAVRRRHRQRHPRPHPALTSPSTCELWSPAVVSSLPLCTHPARSGGARGGQKGHDNAGGRPRAPRERVLGSGTTPNWRSGDGSAGEGDADDEDPGEHPVDDEGEEGAGADEPEEGRDGEEADDGRGDRAPGERRREAGGQAAVESEELEGLVEPETTGDRAPT